MICACPCKKKFEPKRPNQRYATRECKERARRVRSSLVWLTAEERERIERARKGRKSVVRGCKHPFPGYASSQQGRTQYRPLLTTADVAELLQVSEWTVRWWRMRSVQLGPAFIRLGKTRGIRYLRRDVISFLRERRSNRRANAENK